ncbi:cytochrome c [Pantoea sp. MBD-2R]|uniref:c-type cytochrome n=1 Tax=Pantoea sp. MBD-2R TaxID=3141540 RepID=UPI003183D71F
MRLRNLLIGGLVMAGSAQAVPMSEGEYLATAGDCSACHTAPKGKPLAGGVRFTTPLGDIWSTNITPDKQQGIGDYSFEDFDRAMRKGVAKDGHHLYPAMPYTAYAKMDPVQMRALYDYLMQEVQPQPLANRASDIPWPLSMRWPLTVWNALFHDSPVFRPDPQQRAEWNRGAWLVQGPGHCGSCHTPRGWAMQEKGESAADAAYLSGGELAGWYAPSLRGLEPKTVVDLLKTGRSQHSAVAGPMAEVVTHSTQYLTQEDLQAIGAYLHALPALPSAVSHTATTAAGNGKQSYRQYCATCHGSNGEGVDRFVPALAGNTAVAGESSLNAIRVVLEGAHTPLTQQGLSQTMPAYAWTMDDKQVADVMSYIRSSWGNQAAAVTPAKVKAIRQMTEKQQEGK